MTRQPKKLGHRTMDVQRQPIQSWAAERDDCSGPSQATALQFLIIATLSLAVFTAWFATPELLLPSMGVAGLAAAAIVAMVAWRWNVSKQICGLSLWDVSGIFALIGLGACILGDADAVAHFFAGSESQPSAVRR